MASNRPSTWSLVLVPAGISLVVTILRLVGELQGYSEVLFDRNAPGSEEQQAGWIGISWLIPVFGAYFGYRLRAGYGEPQHLGMACVKYAVAAGIVIGGFLGLGELGLVSVPNKDAPGEPHGLPYSLALVFVAALVGLTAWWRLGRTLLLYALLARIPVAIVTVLAVQNEWDTHYTKLPEGMVLAEGTGPLLYLLMPQFTFWILFTLLAGGLFGCLGAVVARKPRW